MRWKQGGNKQDTDTVEIGTVRESGVGRAGGNKKGQSRAQGFYGLK